MKRYGSKKASRPCERIHRVKCRRGVSCGFCRSFGDVRVKSHRAYEKRMANLQVTVELS